MQDLTPFVRVTPFVREQWGSNTVRHDGHQLPNGDTGMPHYQHRNGGRGHVFYEFTVGLTFVGAFGDSFVTQGLDMLNPISDIAEVLDMVGAGPDSGEGGLCDCSQ